MPKEIYISLEKAKKILAQDYAYAAADLLDSVPHAVVEEVVRCEKCSYYGVYQSTGNGYCKHPDGLRDPKPTDFCSHRESKEYQNIQYIDTGVTDYIDTGVMPIVKMSPSYIPPIKGIRFYDSETLIHDYTPCKNPEGIEGMYDLIDEVFLTTEEILQLMNEHYSRADYVKINAGGVAYEWRQSDERTK